MTNSCADSEAASNLLLGRDDLSPVIVTNPGGTSPFLLVGDHAGRAIPRRLGGLGLAPAAMDRHIAWDIGVAGLGERLALNLDAVFIHQAYSRLVIDCNRAPGSEGSIPEVSDAVAIPGNAGLRPADAVARHDAIYLPYQTAIASELDSRARAGAPTLLVSLHSFTPVFQGHVRPWRIGVLHRGDSRLSDRMLGLLIRELGDAAGDNQPYRMDEIDNTVPLHADPRGLDYLELEIRQDLIADLAGQAEVATRLATLLTETLEESAIAAK